MTIPRFAIVLTHNRPELLKQCVAAIRLQADITVVIDNASNPPVRWTDFPHEGNPLVLKRISLQPPNLSYLWNIGLESIQRRSQHPQWDVAVLCDDVIIPEGWFETVSTCMREHGAAAASTHQWSPVPAPVLKKAPDRDIANRMCGWAFVLAGEKEIRADEDLKWWWTDTAIDWMARMNGGMVICPGPVAKNILPNDFTARIPELNHQSGADGETFARKYGGKPW